MPWDWMEIERNWLQGGRIAVDPDDVVAAFDRVEETFGREWIELTRTNPAGSVATGALSVLHVASLGEWLGSLDGVRDADELLERLRRQERSGVTEAIAIHILRGGDPSVEIELAPTIMVGRRERKPDFRARSRGSEWVYVEVTAAETSQAGRAVYDVFARLKRVIDDASAPAFAVEFFLRDVPTVEQQEALIARGLALCDRVGEYEEELPDGLGRLRLNLTQPGKFVVDDPPGESRSPRLSAMHRKLGPGVDRHVVVRVAFTDDRAEQFLRAEARQLPTNAPGLIVMFPTQMRWDAWEATLPRRFTPDMHTRVSAVCLAGSGIWGTERGEAWVPATKLILNDHATFVLPEWAREQLSRFESRDAGAAVQPSVQPNDA